MVKLVFTLPVGLTIGSQTHQEIEIAELNTGEIFAAEKEAEEVRLVFDKIFVVSSDSKLSKELLRRGIKKLGTLAMPLSEEAFDALCRTDLLKLQEKVKELDAAVYEKVSTRGRDKPGTPGILQNT